MEIAVEIARHRIVGHHEIDPAVIILIHEHRGEPVIGLRVGDARLFAHVYESAISIIVKQMVALSGQAARPTHQKAHATKLARARGDSSLACNRRTVCVKLHITRYEQIQQAIVIIIAPSWSGGPSSECHSGFFSHVCKCSIMIVMVEAIFSKIRNVDVRPAIIIVIAHGHAKAPSLVRYTGFVRNVCESAIVIVVKQHGPRRGFLAFQSGKRGTIE